MSVAIEISPNPAHNAASYHFLITGLVPAHTVAVNTFSDVTTPFAGTAVTGTADAQGNFAGAITAQSTNGPYIMIVEDTVPSPKTIVALLAFKVVT